MDYKRYENESDEELIYRVCQDKDKIGSWQQVADILNELLHTEYTESKFRKSYQAFQKMLIGNQSKFVDFDEQKKELEELRESIQNERYKLQATKIEKRRYDRQDSRFDLFFENVEKAKERLEPPTLMPTYDIDNDKESVVGMGDIHYGAKFKSKNNEYSRNICKERFEELLGTLSIYIQDNQLSKIKILNVGDTIQGILRMTDLQINDIPILDCVVEISRLLATFLNELSAYCEIEYYHVPMANHTQIRPLGSKASEIATEDLEKVIINYISDLLIANGRVKIYSDLEKDYIDFKAFDFDCVALHGHQVKNAKDIIKDLSNVHRKFYSYAFLGHTHSANEIIVGEEKNNNIEVLTIPSFIGSDPHADSLNVGSKSMVKIYEFDRIHGHIGSKYIILN